MTFTYDLTTTGDDLIISKIRLEIGDADSSTDAGVKPDGTNFADAELSYFYDDEGGVLAAAARACEVLARMWAGASESTRLRDYAIDTTRKADYYRQLAKDLRARAGSLYVGGSAPVTRVDGYSNDVNSRQNEAETGDYGAQVIRIRTR